MYVLYIIYIHKYNIHIHKNIYKGKSLINSSIVSELYLFTKYLAQ